jgi:hypothetical protein
MRDNTEEEKGENGGTGRYEPLLRVRSTDHVVDAWDEDVAREGDEAAHECDEVRHRLVDRAAEDACGGVSVHADVITTEKRK